MNGRGRVSTSVVISLLVEVLNKLAPLIVIRHATQVLGAGAFGVSQFALSVIEVSIPFVTFGYHYVGATELHKLKDDKAAATKLIANLTALKFFHALLASGIILTLLAFRPDWGEYRWVLIATVPFLFLSALDRTYLNIAFQRMTNLALWNGAFKLVSLVTIVLFVRSATDSTLYAVATLMASAGVSLVSIIQTRRSFAVLSFDTSSWPSIFKRALPFAAVLVIYPLFERFDVFFAEAYGGADALGVYVAPWRLVASLTHFFMVVASVFLSEAVASESNEFLTRNTENALILCLSLTLPALVGIGFVGRDVLAFMFGADFVGMYHTMLWQTSSILMQSIVVIFGMQVLLLNGMRKKLLASLIVGVLVGLAFAWSLARARGIDGIAPAAFIGRFVATGLISYFALRKLENLRLQRFFGVGVSTAVMALALELGRRLGLNWMIQIGMGSAVFGASFYGFYRSLLKR